MSKKVVWIPTLLFIMILFLASAPGVLAEDAKGPVVDVTVGVDMLNGDTTYQIGGNVNPPGQRVHFPISELEFPLDAFMVSIGTTVQFGSRNQWIIGGKIRKNITDDAGTMKDSDWGYYRLSGIPYPWSRDYTLDIYSESDAELDALILDLSVDYSFYQTKMWSFLVGLGYLRENFDYEISNTHQWYPSIQDFSGDYYNGKTGEYEITYSIPYMRVGAKFVKPEKYSLEATFGYSPFVDVEDEDSHLLRDKVNKGDLEGDAILLSFEGRIELPRNFFLSFELDYKQIDTDGTSKAYFGGVFDHEIDEEVESTQTILSLILGYSFF